jgi:hypothetical protein
MVPDREAKPAVKPAEFDLLTAIEDCPFDDIGILNAEGLI